MGKVKCNSCGQIMVLGKPKHRWLDKENDIALKYHQCPVCKAMFPSHIQTNRQLADIRELQAMRARIKEIAAKKPADNKAIEDATTEAEIFQLGINQAQEILKRQYGEGLGFFVRQCPKCGLDVIDMQAARHLFGEIEDEDGAVDEFGQKKTKKIYRARLVCACGWVGRWPELKTVES